MNQESCVFAPGVDLQGAPVGFQDSKRDAETKTRAFSNFLCGKKGLQDFFPDGFRNPVAAVRDSDGDSALVCQSVDFHPAFGQALNCIKGIVQEIQEHLGYLGGPAFDCEILSDGVHFNPDVMVLEACGAEREGVFEDCLEGFSLVGILTPVPGKALKSLDDP